MAQKRFRLKNLAPLWAMALMTNSLKIENPPSWVKESIIQKVAARIESKLEWSPRRVNAYFYNSEQTFSDAHGFHGSPILAFYRRQTTDLHFGPRVDKNNFEMVLTHEMSHAVIAQKYKDHLPKWLEEGLANWTAKNDTVPWKDLAKLQPRMDPREAAHPFQASEFQFTEARYMVSLAAVHFLKKECPSLRELLNLSLKSNLEKFLPTYCQIKNLKEEFWAFVDKRVKQGY
jgi:hypothetical protein